MCQTNNINMSKEKGRESKYQLAQRRLYSWLIFPENCVSLYSLKLFKYFFVTQDMNGLLYQPIWVSACLEYPRLFKNSNLEACTCCVPSLNSWHLTESRYLGTVKFLFYDQSTAILCQKVRSPKGVIIQSNVAIIVQISQAPSASSLIWH